MKRICKKCGEEKELEEFVKDKRKKHGYEWRCKDCKNKYNREWDKTRSDDQKEKKLRAQRIWRKTSKGKRSQKKYSRSPKRKEANKRWHQKDESKERARVNVKLRAKALSDSYIKSFLFATYGLRVKNITQQMIELKRIQLKFHREIKKGKGLLNEIYSNV